MKDKIYNESIRLENELSDLMIEFGFVLNDEAKIDELEEVYNKLDKKCMDISNFMEEVRDLIGRE